MDWNKLLPYLALAAHAPCLIMCLVMLKRGGCAANKGRTAKAGKEVRRKIEVTIGAGEKGA